MAESIRISPPIHPLRFPEVGTTMQEGYEVKHNRNALNGSVQLSSADYRPFVGYKADCQLSVFNTILQLTPNSHQEVKQRVLEPLEQLAAKYGVPAIFAGRGDLPPHITLHMNRFDGVSNEVRVAMIRWLQSKDSLVEPLTKTLVGQTFSLNSLIMAPNSYIGVKMGDFESCEHRGSCPHREQSGPYRVRQLLERRYTRAVREMEARTGRPLEGSFRPPYRYNDIMHLSVSRLTKTASNEGLIIFAMEAQESVGTAIQQDPVRVTVERVFNGTALEFMQTHAPHLLIL